MRCTSPRSWKRGSGWGSWRELEGRRKRLELPALDQEMLSGLLANFDHVMAKGPDPRKEHLLRRLVKKVLVHDRRTVEVWYGFVSSAS